MDKINQKLYYALISNEPFPLKNMAVLRQELDMYILKYGVRMLAEALKDRWYCFVRDGQWRVCAEKGKEDDYILLL